MMKTFNIAEDSITTQITVTNGFFDGGVGTLAGSNFTTSSLSSTQKSYYYIKCFHQGSSPMLLCC